MYIEHDDPKRKIRKEKQIDNFLAPKPEKKEEELLESPHDFQISEHSTDVLAHWRAPEYEVFERDKKWYMVVTLILVGIIAWALYSNSPVMAITFILIGIVGYLRINQEPRTIDFMITTEGVTAGKEIYEYDNLESFWIFYEPEGLKSACLHTKSGIMPYVHIPIHEEDPVHIRQLLLEFLPEEKKEPGLVETMERLLKI